MKLPNKAEGTVAEAMEQRGDAKRNALQTTTRQTPSWESVSPGLERIRENARTNPKLRFTALLHHITPAFLRVAYFSLKRKAAPGVDGVTWDAYGEDLEIKLNELHGRIHRGAYRALPSRRRMIPKPDGRERPLGIASLEDKIVQRAVVEVLNAIYEADFLGFSYGFRPKRSQHDALDALAFAVEKKKVNWILDADLRAYFETVNHDWLLRFLEVRIGDRRIIRLICKWLKAGVMDDGLTSATVVGTPQGAVVSPLLSNIYLHYCFDLWANRWRHRDARGQVILIRYADDYVAGFQHEDDARAFLANLKGRLEPFGLSLHPHKTRLVEFGRYAAERRTKRGQRKPETFTFLGFTHICGTDQFGNFALRRQTRRDRLRRTLRAVREQMHKRMHHSIPEQGRWLGNIVRGYLAYYAVPTNTRAIGAFRWEVIRIWRQALKRQSQRARAPWKQMDTLAARWLPTARVLHPWPTQRFIVNHSR
jgi:group II intron reverse transcriptase/maturase